MTVYNPLPKRRAQFCNNLSGYKDLCLVGIRYQHLPLLESLEIAHTCHDPHLEDDGKMGNSERSRA